MPVHAARQGLLVLCLALLIVPAWAGDMHSVADKEAAVRAKPRLFSKKLTTLAYGDQVEVTASKQAWRQIVLGDGRHGWIQHSALSREPLRLSAGDRQVGTTASNDELTLAGKGFNNEVEQLFRQRNQKLDYSWVDRMETFSPEEEALQRFVEEGRLNSAGGGDGR